MLLWNISSFQKSNELLLCIITVAAAAAQYWETSCLFLITWNGYLILSSFSDIQLHRGSTGNDENEEGNNTQAYFRGIRAHFLAWNSNPYNLVWLYKQVNHWVACCAPPPSFALSKRQTRGFLQGYWDVLLFYRLLVTGGSGLFSMTNPAINSSCDRPYLVPFCCSCTDIKP